KCNNYYFTLSLHDALPIYNSYRFRPNRSVENAIAATYRLMQKSGLQYVVEFDIKGFFDNVDHSKLIKQLWSLNIRDKELLYVIRSEEHTSELQSSIDIVCR